MTISRLHISASIMAVIVLTIAILVGGGLAWRWVPQDTPYVFNPCPGLTVTSTVTTGIWNCPNQPALTTGQNVTITGTWATGYGTLGCVPLSGKSSCAVPQIAYRTAYLHENIAESNWLVVQWKAGVTVQIPDSQTVTISGTLQAINYSCNPGGTYPIYHLNKQTDGSDLLQPQPTFEITNAILS